jgi:hypothetical protein
VSTRSELGHEDLAGHSTLAIQRRRTESGFELEASAYLYSERLFILTSMMGKPGSAHLEIGQPSVLTIDAADSELGRLVCEHLLRHDHRVPGDLSQLNKSDWGAFQASGSKTLTHFEANSWRADISTVNLVLEFEVAPVRSLHPEIAVCAHTNPIHAEIGAALRRCFEAGRAVRDAGLI